jgi:hypothetical protein
MQVTEEGEMLHLHKKTILILTGFLFLILTSFNLACAGDTYFDISFDRCVSIDSAGGEKRISDIGDSVTLNKKGRLWLTGNETREGFVEIVCQNLSSESVHVELTSMEMPWISVVEPAKCNDWKKNILICSVGDMAKGLFCKINERTIVVAGEGSRKQTSASVNVRAVDLQEDQSEELNETHYLQERIEYYEAGIDLCNTMHERSGNIVINWVIYGGGAVDKVSIDSQTASEDDEVAKCIAEQIPLWRFPRWEKDSQVSYQF